MTPFSEWETYWKTRMSQLSNLWAEGHEVLYLDPLASDYGLRIIPPAKKPWKSQTPEEPTCTLLSSIAAVLGLDASNFPPRSFRGKEGLGTLFKDNRAWQSQLSQTINQGKDVLNSKAPHYSPNLEAFSSAHQEMHNITDKQNHGSLVMVDGVFIRRERALGVLPAFFDTLEEQRYDSTRRVEAILCDFPAGLVLASDPVVPLMVDDANLRSWTPSLDAILRIGWYPHSRVLGLLRSDPFKRYFLDVIAILARPCRSLAHLLRQPVTSGTFLSAPGLLNDVRTKILLPLKEELDELPDDKQQGSLSCSNFRQLTIPLKYVGLSLAVNDETPQLLEQTANDTYQSIVAYYDALVALRPFCDAQAQRITLERSIQELLRPERRLLP